MSGWDPHVDDPTWDHATEGPCSTSPRSEILWLATDLPSYQWPYSDDTPYSFLKKWLPVYGDVWDTYYVPGIPDWDGEESHYPWYHNDPGDTPPNDFAHSRWNNIGVSYDHVDKILTFMQMYYSGVVQHPELGSPSKYWKLLITNIDFTDLDNPVITTTDVTDSNLFWYSDLWGDYVLFDTAELGVFRYCYPTSDGSAVLAASNYWGDMAISLDHGLTWSVVHDLGAIASGNDETYSYCEPLNYYSIAYGTPGSDTIAIRGETTIWKSNDLGETWDLTWVAGYGITWNPAEPWFEAQINGLTERCYALESNRKSDPDCIWIEFSGIPQEGEDGVIQRNTSETLDQSAWEETTYVVVSESYQENIFENTFIHPDDWPVPYDRGTPFVAFPIPSALKYFPRSGRWWAFAFRERVTYCAPISSGFLIFSDDDGQTWSNILCDHKNEENWQYMHPFFSPRCWPLCRTADGYTMHVNMNYSGFGAVCDIIEHPDDPNILVTVGYHWLRSNETVEDPAGRGDGYAYYLGADATPAELAEYSQYDPGLRSLGNHRAAYSMSLDGGATWSQPTSVMPMWAYPYADHYEDELNDYLYYSTNPGAYRLFAIVSEESEEEATGHEPGWNPRETDNVWSDE